MSLKADNMKTREEAARFFENQMDASYKSDLDSKHGAWHYGLQEMKNLLDYLYEGTPANKDEKINPKSFHEPIK